MRNATGRGVVPVDAQSQATIEYGVIEQVEQCPGQ